MRPKVLIAVPNGSGWIHKSVVFQTIRMLGDSRFDSKLILPTRRPYVANLHAIARDMIARGFDYLVSMDDDNPPRPGVNVMELVALDLDVVGCPTPVWHSTTPGGRPFYYNAMREVVTEDGSTEFRPIDSYPDFVESGLKQCDAVGTGCLVIARRVLVALCERAKELGPLETPFMRRWDSSGAVVMGNDFAFCQRARLAGFKVWAHFDYVCHHFNELEVSETISALLGMTRGR